MPDYIALQWGRAGIRGLDATVNGETVRVRASFSHDWPAPLDAEGNPEEVGLWLKARIGELGQRDRRLIVLVSREEIVMRLLALPDARDETLAELVRYQTGARSSVPLDQLELDYLPLDAAPPRGGRWVQTATVPQRTLQQIKACAKLAGLELCAVGLTTVAIGEAVTRAARMRKLSPDRDTLIICVAGGQLDVALWRGADLLFGHAARATDPQVVAGEVQRALMSHQGVAGDSGARHVWLIAPPASETELQAILTTRLGCDVIVFDRSRDLPVAVQAAELPADTGSVIAAMGALLASTQAEVPTIDFLKPRRRVAQRDRTKIFAAASVCLLLVLLAAAYLASRLYVNALDQRIADRTNLVETRDNALQLREPAREAAEFLSAWDSQRADWLDHMRRMGGEMPGTERIYLDRWRFDQGQAAALGTTEAVGFARQRQDAEQLTQRLAEQPGWRIRPNSIGSGGSDPDYPILFQLNAELVKPDRRPARNESE